MTSFLLHFFRKGRFKMPKNRFQETIFTIMMVLAISVFSVLFMCPMMSFVATILFKGAWGTEVIAVWLETTVKNFPMAFFWQLMFAGPLVRGIFGKIFSEKKTDKKPVIQEG